MFDELKKYKNNSHFFFKRSNELKDACNAPSDKRGVYIVYALSKGKIEKYQHKLTITLMKD